MDSPTQLDEVKTFSQQRRVTAPEIERKASQKL